jgi:hypothetical protein
MLKFRALKDKIIYSKRNSQKLSEEELFSLIDEQPSLSRLNISLAAKLQTQINQITEQNYKIFHSRQVDSRKRVTGSSAKKQERDRKG